jgi:hypothetical protein
VHVVCGHRAGQREGGALAGAVESPLADTHKGHHRAHVHYGRMRGGAGVRERRPSHPRDACDVDVQHARPLGVVVLSDVADSSDACVVHHDVEGAEPVDDRRDGLVDLPRIGDVAGHGQCALGCAVRIAFQDGDPRAPLLEQPGGGLPDATRTAGDQGDEAVEVTRRGRRAHRGPTTRCRCDPRPSIPSSMTSPGRSHTGGTNPMPTPGGVPVLIRSPGSITRNWLR